MVSELLLNIPYNNVSDELHYYMFSCVVDAEDEFLVDMFKYKKINDATVDFMESMLIKKADLGRWNYGKFGAS